MTSTTRVPRRLAAAAVTAGLLLVGQLLIPDTAGASTSTTTRPTPSVAGTVLALAQSKGRTLVGGSFAQVGTSARQNLAAIRADGTVDPTWQPQANGTVRSLAVSADGTVIFIGGDFTQVSGLVRRHLAAVDATTGAVLRGFRPVVSRPVLALAVSGSALYVGGSFGSVNGLAVPRLARLDPATGAVDPAFVPAPDARVRAITVAPDGTRVYPAGSFTTVAGVARPGFAELVAATGAATSFQPSQGGDALAVVVTADGARVLVSFRNNRTLAFDPKLTSWPVYTLRTDGAVQAIALGAEEAYIGGKFSALTDYQLDRPRLASFLISDGTPTGWRVVVGGGTGVYALRAAQTYLAVGGDFTRVGRQAQSGLIRFDGAP